MQGFLSSALLGFYCTKYKLILFDIDMPQVDGMTAAKEILKITPDIKMIFITAFPDYALEVFEIYSMDYILKPINPERLKQTIELIKQHTELAELATGAAQKTVERIISIKQRHETVFLETEEIIMIERQNRKTLLHFPDRIFSTNIGKISDEDSFGTNAILACWTTLAGKKQSIW